MVARTVRIYYSNRLEAARYACDVDLPGRGGWTIRVGSDQGNELVLPGRHVPGLAAAILLSGSTWLIEPYHGPCVLDERELHLGRRWPLPPGLELRLGEYTLVLEDFGGAAVGAPLDRDAADREAGELLERLHAELLPRLPRDREADSPQARDEHLLDVEHSIADLCDRHFRELRAGLVDHIAGLAVRGELLGRIIEASERGDAARPPSRPAWSKLVSVVPELERDLSRLMRSLDAPLGLTATPEIRGRIEALDGRFWPAWETHGSPMVDLGLRSYLAQRHCKKEIKDLIFGLGPLEDLLRTPTVDEIMVNDAEHIFIEHDGTLKNSGRRFVSDAVTRSIIERIVARVGRRIDRSQPLVDARMADGSRVNAVIPPIAVNGPCLTIRKFAGPGLDAAELERRGTLTPAAARFLRAAVEARRNVLISGGTGAGKTTLLNCLGAWVPATERIVTVEDTAELRLDHPHVVRLETRDRNLEGQGALTIRDLVRNALRMRPDRIVVGECRGAEALDMLQAMNTGHDGSLTTIHANSTADVIGRLEVMVLQAAPFPVPAIHRQIASAIHLVVQLERRPGGARRVSQISEMAGYDRRREAIRIRHLFEIDPDTGRLEPTGSLPTYIADLVDVMPIELFHGDSAATKPGGS